MHPPARTPDPGPDTPDSDRIGRRAVIARSAVGLAVWSAPVILGSVASPAGAITGAPPAPPAPSGCRTVNHNTVVTYAAPAGFAITAHAVSTSCAGTVALTSTAPTSTITLEFPKQILHWVRLVLESVPAGDCYLAVFEVTSPNPNGSSCNINQLVGTSSCTSAVSGSPCSPLQRLEP